MAREKFIDNLRVASRHLGYSTGSGHMSGNTEWLSPKSVEGFSPKDFPELSDQDKRNLSTEITAFLKLAGIVAEPDAVQAARNHLASIIEIIGHLVVKEWLEAQNSMIAEAATAAKKQGWHTELDDREIAENLIGKYRAPRLRIKSLDREVVLNPMFRFGSGHKGVVDLVSLPTFDTEYLVTYKKGRWWIESPNSNDSDKPFNGKSLISTISNINLTA